LNGNEIDVVVSIKLSLRVVNSNVKTSSQKLKKRVDYFIPRRDDEDVIRSFGFGDVSLEGVVGRHILEQQIYK